MRVIGVGDPERAYPSDHRFHGASGMLDAAIAGDRLAPVEHPDWMIETTLGHAVLHGEITAEEALVRMDAYERVFHDLQS